MKAIQITQYLSSLSSLQVSSIPPPSFPSNSTQNHVLIAITHTALNYVDILFTRGQHQNNHSGLTKPPFVLGLEFAGVVISCSLSSSSNPSKRNFRPGDHVWGVAYGSGGFAEQVVVSEEWVWHVPLGWSLRDAAGLGAATVPVSYEALVKVGRARKGETVLIHAAAGGLGVAAVQIMIALGCNVIGTVGSDAKAEIVRQLGNDCERRCRQGGKLIGVVKYDHDGWEKEVKKLCPNNSGVDLVYDSVGLVEKSLKCVNLGGRIMIIGFVGLDGKMEKIAMNRVLLKMVSVIGYRFGESRRQHLGDFDVLWNEMNEILEKREVEPVICKTYNGLESVSEALQDLEARKIWGKAVVEVQTEQEALELVKSMASRGPNSKL